MVLPTFQYERDTWRRIAEKLEEKVPAEQKEPSLRREDSPELRLKAENARLRMTNNELDAANKGIRQEAEETKEKNTELEQRNSSLEAEVRRQKEAAQALAEENARLKQDNKAYRQAYAETNQARNLAETETVDLRAANGRWRERNERLFQHSQQLEQQNRQLQEQLKAAQAEADRLKSEKSRGTIRNGLGGLELTKAEVAAIRKAMARIHHPDTGGDQERMKQLNALLDTME